MSHAFTPYKERLGDGDADWSGNDIRAMLCATNTTADTDQDAGTIAAIGTLDEFAGSGYARHTFAGEDVDRDDANNRAELKTTTPITFGATVGAGVRAAAGMLIYRHVDGTAANDLPMLWIDSGGFPLNGAGGPYEAVMNAEGWAQIT